MKFLYKTDIGDQATLLMKYWNVKIMGILVYQMTQTIRMVAKKDT